MAGLRLNNIVNERFLNLTLRVLVHDDLSIPDMQKIRDLMKEIDYVHYSKDNDVFTLLTAVKLVSEVKIDGCNDLDMLVSTVETNLPDTYAESITNFVIPTISTETTIMEQERRYVLRSVSTFLKYGYLMKERTRLSDLFLNLSTGNIFHVEETIGELKNSIHELDKKLQSSDVNDIDKTTIIHTSDPEFIEKYFKKSYELATRPKRVLKMGLRKLNRMFSSDLGLPLGKMILINAPTNSFKTGTMMYIAKWIQKYNSWLYEEEYKKTGKRPCILFASFENNWSENTARYFSMYTGTNLGNVSKFTDAASMWKEHFDSNGSIIDICMLFADANKFGVSNLRQSIEELETSGYKVIATFVDYLKIMADDLNGADARRKVINISTDLHILSVEKPDMALVTAHHTNRAGDELITETVSRGGVDKIKGLGRQHLSEAHGVEDPIDFSFYVSPEISPYNGKTYLAFLKGKCRYERTDVEYFVHEMVNGFHIIDDIELPESTSLPSIASTAPTSAIGNRSKQNYQFKSNRGVTNMRNNNSNQQQVQKQQPTIQSTPTPTPLFSATIDIKREDFMDTPPVAKGVKTKINPLKQFYQGFNANQEYLTYINAENGMRGYSGFFEKTGMDSVSVISAMDLANPLQRVEYDGYYMPV